MNSAYDPSLLVRRFSTTGALNTPVGADRVLIGNLDATDIAPRAAICNFGSEALVAYRDAGTGVPLTLRRIAEDASLTGNVVTLESTLEPVALRQLGVAEGAILIGRRLVAGQYELFAQRLGGSDLQPLGDEVELFVGSAGVDVTNSPTDQGLLAVAIQRQSQLLRANTCVE